MHTLVYGSTTGVYGDAGGAFFDETRAVAPASARGRGRVSTPRRRCAGSAARMACAQTILRIPGIYAA